MHQRFDKKGIDPKRLINIAILTAIVIVLQAFASSVTIGEFSITMDLIPIVIGAACFGPGVGAWLGFVFGIVVLFSDDVNALLAVTPMATLLVLLIKGILAGYAAGMVFRAFSGKSFVMAAVLAAFVCPVVNTGVFSIGARYFLEYMPQWKVAAGDEGPWAYILLNLVGGNFLLELLLNLVLSPLILMLIYIGVKRTGRGESEGFQAFGDRTWRISLSEKLYFLINWLILVLSILEMVGAGEITVRRLLFVLAVMFVSSAVSVLLMNHVVTKPLGMLSKAARNFNGSDTGYRKEDVISLDIHSHDEIGELYYEIQSMQNRIVGNTESLKHVTAEKERIVTELGLASRIQESMLPNIFPPYPHRMEFDIYASMDPAKEVGGDFYDFFLVDDDHLGLVIADVSGKGIPASLFMMASKIILAQNAKAGKSPARILEDANRDICSNNAVELFVTVWVGILELSTGRLTAANAGHEYPILKGRDGAFEVLMDRHSFVVGGMEDIQYSEYELQLEPGSVLFLYTDGLPEAINSDQEAFGQNRTLAVLNGNRDAAPEQLLRRVREAVDAFVEDEEQFDDLTMLCLRYNGTGTGRA